MSAPTRDAKSELRARIRARIAAMTPRQRHEASAEACQRLIELPSFERAATVMLYLPLPDEVDLAPVALHCFQTGRKVCVPLVDWQRRTITAVETLSFDDEAMTTDGRGLRTPRDGRPVLESAIDLVVVPGVAYDLAGRRLGRGGGYYDRFLPRLRPDATVIGLAFDVQVVQRVPVVDHDRMVDAIVTETRVCACTGGAAAR